MFASELNLLGVAGSALVVLGFIGTVLPIVPGPIIIWLGAFVWAWGDGFQRIGWPTLAVLGLLAVLAWGMDFFLTAVVSRRAGASWQAIGGAIVGGLLGGMLLSGTPPILGSIIGALLETVARACGSSNTGARATSALHGSPCAPTSAAWLRPLFSNWAWPW
ncbi:MAG: DUF456 domain-containing protein [Caldilineaceae bacterium]